MRFGPSVVMFALCGLPLVGNLNNGFVIGLTPQGANLCERLAFEDVPEDDVRNVDESLFGCLQAGGFFDQCPTTPQPMSAYLHVTQRCNLKCAGCYSMDDTRNLLPDASTSDLLCAIEKLAHLNISLLLISGGEPFLRSDLAILVRHAKKCGIHSVTVITNGTCVNDGILSELAPYADSISVSFDGYSADSPAFIRGDQRFNQLVDAVRRIQAVGLSAHIVPTVHRKSVGDLAKYAKLAQRLGATMNYSLLSCECSANEPLADLLPDETTLSSLADELFEMGDAPVLSGAPIGLNLSAQINCGAGVKEISIAADGRVYPCHMLMRSDYVMGNIFLESLADILNSPVAQKLAALNVTDFEGCTDCRHQLLCGGGYRARSVYTKGNLKSRDPYCALISRYYDQLGATLSSQIN